MSRNCSDSFPKLNSSSSARHLVESGESEARKSLAISEGADISQIWLCEALEEHLRPGLTEHDILSIVYKSYIKNGGEPGIHFIATTHMDQSDRFVAWTKPTPRVLELGSVVITELTVSYWGYSTQIH